MRAELRRQLPKTRGCGALIVLAALAVLAALGYVLWRWVQDSPARLVQRAMKCAIKGDLDGLEGYLTKESLDNANADQWVPLLAVALGGKKTCVQKEQIVGDEATVNVQVIERAASGVDTRTDLPVTVVRVKGKGWRIQLDKTMRAASPQFWQSIAAAHH